MMSLKIKNFDVTWRIYDGFDWENTRKVAAERKLSTKRSKLNFSDVISQKNGSVSSNSNPANNIDSYFGTPSEFEYASNMAESLDDPPSKNIIENSDADSEGEESEYKRRRNEDWWERGSNESISTATTTTLKSKMRRSKTHKIEIRVVSISIDFDVYPAQNRPDLQQTNSIKAELAFRMSLSVRDIEIIDNVRSSKWRMFLSYLSDEIPRETNSDMIQIEILSVRPSPETSSDEELRLKVKVLPLRFHIDQDALVCLIRFFSFEDPQKGLMPEKDNTDSKEPFIQFCQVYPITVKIDYKPKRVDYANLQGGNFVEIMNFFPLDGAEMTLRDVKLTGQQGWNRLIEGLIREWLPHIRDTQVPRVVSGVSGVKSVVNVSSGIADLILLPIEQYRKDGRVIRGIQRGAKSFAKAATMETLRMGTRLAVGTQVLLEHADELLSNESTTTNLYDAGSSSIRNSFDSNEDDEERPSLSKFSDPPRDVKEGIGLAYQSLSRNVGQAARTILAIPMEVYERNGNQGTARAVIRAVPIAVLKPMIGASEAVSKTLLGIQNTIDPSRRRYMEDKYK
ncbi:autophagy- protein 2 [Nowakowskiella sp. JEL0078]|nr:autophagy- protein 2 [Nowakowskiella sp. JEL0078]